MPSGAVVQKDVSGEGTCRTLVLQWVSLPIMDMTMDGPEEWWATAMLYKEALPSHLAVSTKVLPLTHDQDVCLHKVMSFLTAPLLKPELVLWQMKAPSAHRITVNTMARKTAALLLATHQSTSQLGQWIRVLIS